MRDLCLTDTTKAEYEENVDTPRPGESGLRNRDRRRLRSRCLLGTNSKSWFWEGCQHFYFAKPTLKFKRWWLRSRCLLAKTAGLNSLSSEQSQLSDSNENIDDEVKYFSYHLLSRLLGTLHSSWQIFSKREHKSNFGERKKILSSCEVIAISNSFSKSTKKSPVFQISPFQW